MLRVGLTFARLHLTGDPADYHIHAAYIATGHGYPPTIYASPGTPSAFRPPAYPYLLGGLYAVVGIDPDAGRLLGAVLGVVVVLLTAVLASRVWDRRVGLIAGTLAALCPSLVALNATLLSESLFLPLELGVVLSIIGLRRTAAPLRLAMLAGGLCGLGALTRSAAVVWLIPLLAAAAVRADPPLRRLAAAALALLAFVVVLLPWAIRNTEAMHQFVPLNTQGGYTLVGQYNSTAGHNDAFQAVWRSPPQIAGLDASLMPLYRRPGGVNEAQLDSRFAQDALTYARRHLSHIPIAFALDALRMFNLGKKHQFTTGLAYREMGLPPRLWDLTTISIQVITVIALLGVLARFAGLTRRRLGGALVWTAPVLTVAATALLVGTVRYRVPADPFLILLAAVAIAELLERLRPVEPRRESGQTA